VPDARTYLLHGAQLPVLPTKGCHNNQDADDERCHDDAPHTRAHDNEHQYPRVGGTGTFCNTVKYIIIIKKKVINEDTVKM